MKIQLHSMTDLITNSSTVIYTYSDSSEAALRVMIDEIFKVFGINKTCDDVFNLSVTLEEDYLYSERFHALDNGNIPEELQNMHSNDLDKKIQEIVNKVKNGEIEKPNWMAEVENKDYDYTRSTTLNITPKAPEYQKLATMVKNFLYSPSHEASYNG
jgi:hypothetical protein